MIFGRIFQVLMDLVVGLAAYFAMAAFVPSLSYNIRMVIALAITAIFAEFVEIKLKRE